MARDGIVAATTRAICEEAGMANGFFHYCFTSKQELMTEVIGAFLSRSERVMLVSTREGDLDDVLRGVFAAFLDDMVERRAVFQMGYELLFYLLRDEQLAPIAAQWYLQYGDIIVQSLARVAEVARATWTAPVTELARHAALYIEGVTIEWLAVGDDERAHGHLEALVDYLMDFAGDASA
jgi:AcrR family transcriptional regulator